MSEQLAAKFQSYVMIPEGTFDYCPKCGAKLKEQCKTTEMAHCPNTMCDMSFDVVFYRKKRNGP